MITLLGSLIGFFSAAFPDVLKLFRERADSKHELMVLQLQLQQQAQGHTERLAEIRTQADSAEIAALYKTYRTDIRWVDALNGTVRPVLAYAFFALYAALKAMEFALIDWATPLPWQLERLWSTEDQAIFAGIISFYFGQRAMRKIL